MSAELQPALDRLTAATVELRLASEAVLAVVSAKAGAPLLPPDLSRMIPRIIDLSASAYRITPAELQSDTRRQPIAAARQMAMAICLERTGATQRQIASYFGRKEHGTVSFAANEIRNRVATERRTAAIYATIIAQLAA